MSRALPAGVRFIGREDGALPAWQPGHAPDQRDIALCVGCGLCLPHCPTFRLTGDETASPRGRIAAMRAVDEGFQPVNARFAQLMDACLGCRACETACPSLVPYGRMLDAARQQARGSRPLPMRIARRLGVDVVLGRPWMITAASAMLAVVRPVVPGRLKRLIPSIRLRDLMRPLPPVAEPTGPIRGSVVMLSGCIQDRLFRSVNEATIRVLNRNGWRVLVPRQGCCGALTAHYGSRDAAQRMAIDLAADLRASGPTWIVVNAAGCSAHMKEYAGFEGAEAVAGRVRDVFEFLVEQGWEPPARSPLAAAAYHDPCHLLHAQHVAGAARSVMAAIPGLSLLEIPDGDRCCGSAGLYNVFEPVAADALMREKAANVAATGCGTVLAGNPGCAMQIQAGLRELGSSTDVRHPIEVLDAAYGPLRPTVDSTGAKST
jgi:glycolate oxidase iron-sulfur subunit